jgi:hypothetical protein
MIIKTGNVRKKEEMAHSTSQKTGVSREFGARDEEKSADSPPEHLWCSSPSLRVERGWPEPAKAGVSKEITEITRMIK